MNRFDDNDRLVNGTLSHDPESDCVPYAPCNPIWDEPLVFDECDRPPFPTNSLPEAFARFVREEAEATQTPLELAGALVIGALAGSVAGKARVLVKPGYSEPLNLFVVVALPPGERKSAVFGNVMRPIEDEERDLIEQHKPLFIQHAANEELSNEAIKSAKERLRKATDAERQTTDRELRSLVEKQKGSKAPVQPRLLASSVTPEKLEALLEEQGGRLIVSSPEGEIFDIAAGRYSKHGGPNIEALLKGHAGDPIRVDRMGRPPVSIARPALTLVLAVQPEVIHSLAGQPAFRGRGLLARFLYSLPTSRVGTRCEDPPPVSDFVRSDYASRVRALVASPLPTVPADLKLSDGASSVLREFARALEPRLHSRTGDLTVIVDWAAKLVGAVARIAGVLHCATHPFSESRWVVPIAEDTMRGACELGHYFLAHARAAFGDMSTTSADADARAVLQWIRDRKQLASVSARDVQRGLSRKLRCAKSAERALLALEERGFVQRVAILEHGKGRPRSPTFAVHPSLMQGRQVLS